MANLYELRGIPNNWLEYDAPPDYVLIFEYDDVRGTFNDPHGLTPGEVRLWAQAEYWTATEAALLLAGVSPDDPDLYSVSREVVPDEGFGTVYYAWKYSFEFIRASESLFLFKRSSLAPKASPLEWVKYHDRNIRKTLGASDFAPRRYDGWLEFFDAELDGSSPSENNELIVADVPGRRAMQHEVILAVIAALGYDPQTISYEGKGMIRDACLTRTRLFTGKGNFKTVWQEGLNKHLFKTVANEKSSSNA